MERTDYPGLLPKLQPGQAVDILSERVRSVGRLNTAIADWLQERSRLEEQYAAGLRKLARRPVDENDLGIFTVPWSTITNSMDTLADSHSSLASKLEVEVEQPLRAFQSSNREMQAMTTIQGNLASMAKDVDRAQQKTDKLQNKSERADPGKVANANSELDNAKQQWDSQAPYVFENLQALDETRVNQLRDLLTQFQTLEVDQVEKARVAAEQCLNVLLNVETQDEIKTFALKALSKPRPAESSRATNRLSVVPGIGGPSLRTGSSSGNALAPITSNDEDGSQFSASTPESSKKSGFKGLKRLGTVMSRRSSKQPSSLPATSESPERKGRTLPGPFGRLGRNKDSYSLEPPQEEASSRRPSSPLRMGSEIMEPPSSRHEPTSPASTRPPQLDPIPQVNGSAAGFPNGSHQGDLADLEPPRPVQQDPPTMPVVAEPQRDSEGFSVPPQNLDPISQAQAEAAMAGERPEPQYNVNIRSAPIQEEGSEAALANMAGKLQAPPPVTRRAGTVRGRRDNRNSAVISTYGPPDQAAQEPLTVATPPTTERTVEPEPINTQVPAPAVQPPVEASTTSLVQSPSGAFSSSGGVTPFSPFSPAEPTSPLRSRAPLGADHTGDNQSIRSGRSLQSTASHTMKHPELQAPGLSSSIVETVSARFENGKTVSSSIIGEIAMAYNAADFNTPFGHESIRLENFSALEKVAPNPAFINQSPEKEGEYTVNLANLSRTQVAFKYQLRGDQAASTHLPLMISNAFKIEPTQTMVIVSYSLHPNFVIPDGRDSVTFHNVMIALTLDGARASGCQSKPVGTFSREKNLVFWQLGDITLSAGAAPEKLLAKFATETEAKGGSAEARWEILGEHAAGLGNALSVSQSAAGEEGADPFADAEGAGGASWKMVPLVKKIASGHYVAKS